MRDIPVWAKWALGSVACLGAAFGGFRAARGVELTPKWAGTAGWLDAAAVVLCVLAVFFACFSVASLDFVRRVAQRLRLLLGRHAETLVLAQQRTEEERAARVAAEEQTRAAETAAATAERRATDAERARDAAEARASAADAARVEAVRLATELETARTSAEARAKEAWANKVEVSLSVEDLRLWEQEPITIETAAEAAAYEPRFAVLRVKNLSPRPVHDVLARLEYQREGEPPIPADGVWSAKPGDHFTLGGARTVDIGVGDHWLLAVAVAVCHGGHRIYETWLRVKREEMPPRFLWGTTAGGKDVLTSRSSGDLVELGGAARVTVRLNAPNLRENFVVRLTTPSGNPVAVLPSPSSAEVSRPPTPP